MSTRQLLHILAVLLVAVAILLLLRLRAASAQTPDPHELYERTCARCHDAHAGTFAGKSLRAVDGRVVGARSARDLDALLEQHHGARLTADERASLRHHFEVMLDTGLLFQQRCFFCHGRAKEFARSKLTERDGLIVSRASGADIEVFLQGHGGLDERQIDIVMAMFHRQLAEPRD